MANTKISQLTTWTGDTTGFYLVVDNSGLTQTYKTTKESLGAFTPEILLKSSSVDQTIAVGNNLTFDLTDFNLNMTSPSNSTVTLKANRTYECRAAMRLTAGNVAGAEITYRWWNNTAGSYTGITGGAVTTDAGGWTGTDVNEALAYITVGSTDISLQLKVVASSSSAQVSANQSRITIKRIA